MFSSISRRTQAAEKEPSEGSSRYLDSESATAAAAASGHGAGSDHPHTRRALLPKHQGELTLRCTEFDAEGNVRVVSGEYKKSELCTKVSSTLIRCWVEGRVGEKSVDEKYTAWITTSRSSKTRLDSHRPSYPRPEKLNTSQPPPCQSID